MTVYVVKVWAASICQPALDKLDVITSFMLSCLLVWFNISWNYCWKKNILYFFQCTWKFEAKTNTYLSFIAVHYFNMLLGRRIFHTFWQDIDEHLPALPSTSCMHAWRSVWHSKLIKKSNMDDSCIHAARCQVWPDASSCIISSWS